MTWRQCRISFVARAVANKQKPHLLVPECSREWIPVLAKELMASPCYIGVAHSRCAVESVVGNAGHPSHHQH
jgi:hypothetical protein